VPTDAVAPVTRQPLSAPRLAQLPIEFVARSDAGDEPAGEPIGLHLAQQLRGVGASLSRLGWFSWFRNRLGGLNPGRNRFVNHLVECPLSFTMRVV
jgi:hypothetical protein